MTRAELAEMIELAERLARANEPAVLATLFSSNGSTYRRLGAMMISGPPGYMAGGVSGGCLEEYIARHGRSITQTQPAAMLSFDADPDADSADKPVLGCGGSIEVLVERCTVNHIAFLKELADAYSIDQESSFACVVNLSQSAAISVTRTASQDNIDSEIPLQRLCGRAIAAGQSRHGFLGEHRRALVHYVPPMTRLIILGAGNDARPLASLARSLDWHVMIADRRARLATRSRFPQANEVIAADWAAAIAAAKFTDRTAVVMMTHSLADDIEILPMLADKPMMYAGSLGPPHRRHWVIDGASKIGALDEAFIARFRGPIGLNLGERSPAGIALSIAAEILAELNGRDANPLSQANDALTHAASNLVFHG